MLHIHVELTVKDSLTYNYTFLSKFFLKSLIDCIIYYKSTHCLITQLNLMYGRHTSSQMTRPTSYIMIVLSPIVFHFSSSLSYH